jgi:hypothetical protein
LWIKQGKQGTKNAATSAAIGTHLAIDLGYNSSTLFRAQGVRRRNFKLDLMLGSLKKQRIGMRFAISAQP